MRRWILVYAVLGMFVLERMASSQANPIHIGPNVHVSQSHGKYTMGEVLLSADPTEPNHLLGCGIVWDEAENRQWTIVYLSNDGGKSWQPTLETKRVPNSSDPACALGRSGLAAYVALGWDENQNHILSVYRSVDGGKTWTQQEDMPMIFQGIDRESLIMDTTQSKFGNRVYITGASDIWDVRGSRKVGIGVWRSHDGGVSYEGPLKRAPTVNRVLSYFGNSVILSDGTLVSLFADLVVGKPEEIGNAALEIVTTTDGGDSISEAIKVDDFHPAGRSLTLSIPTLAVDSGDRPFRDRLYVTWADGRNWRSEIRFTYSQDKGKTWAKSTVIDDVAEPRVRKNGPENFLPTVAVNKAGVVVVTWYDRRENPDGLGWYVRARASLDGGETWLPSVRVSDKPNTFTVQQRLFTFGRATRPEANEGAMEVRPEDDAVRPSKNSRTTQRPVHVDIFFEPRVFFAGDYAGLAADAGGTFHAFWIDNRTGLAQIWTAPISVNGKAVRNGSAELAELEDVSSGMELKIVSSSYDRASNTVTIGVSLKNSSNKLIKGPVKLRLINLSSRIGTPSPANADNQVTHPGAIWDLSRLLNDNGLKPDETSKVKELVFRVDNPRELLDGKNVQTALLDFDVRVLAGGREP